MSILVNPRNSKPTARSIRSSGHYDVRAEGPNFKASEQKNITLAVGDRRRVDFQLQLGNTQQSVTVEANVVAVQADTGEQSGWGSWLTNSRYPRLIVREQTARVREALFSDFLSPRSRPADGQLSRHLKLGFFTNRVKEQAPHAQDENRRRKKADCQANA